MRCCSFARSFAIASSSPSIFCEPCLPHSYGAGPSRSIHHGCDTGTGTDLPARCSVSSLWLTPKGRGSAGPLHADMGYP
jgi:hypothetical protein